MQIEPMRAEELITFIKYKEDFKVVFDVGARGNLEFSQIHPNCEYHLFEPQIGYANYLKETTKDMQNVTVNHMGLGDEVVKQAKFYHNIQSFAPHPFVDSQHNEGDEFDISTIDEYCKEHSIDSIDFVKIDTEGYDYRVLLGAKDMLKQDRIKCIQFEYWDGVQKFVDLLSEKYDMTFMCEDGKEYEFDETIIQWIDQERIPSGRGGDVFCKLKK
jgi:FkbM family methyltransferase